MRDELPLPRGTRLGDDPPARYELFDVIGQGGMGIVYAAFDHKLARAVAIKVLRTSAAADPKAIERLFREARAAQLTDHDGVVRTYDRGTDSKLTRSFIVMEKLEGEDLGQRLKRGEPFSEPELRSLGVRLADVLSAVHAAQVIHRDVKPTNVFYARDRLSGGTSIKLLDFGVAKLSTLQPLTTAGAGHGTPAYMAPEYLADSERLDARVDIYALGVVLYQCATGKTPYGTSDVVELIMRHKSGRVPDVRRLRPALSEHLATVIARCLQCKPEARYPDAISVYAALSREP